MGVTDTSSAARRYGTAILCVTFMLVVRLAFGPLMGSNSPLLAFTLAILAARRFGGLGPCLLATALSILCGLFFFIEPRFSFAIANSQEISGLVLLAAFGIFTGLFPGIVPDPRPQERRLAGIPLLRRMALLAGTFFALLILTRILYVDFQREQKRQSWVTHSYQVMVEIRGLRSTLEDAETGQRGYLLTGDETYLEPYRLAVRIEQSFRLSLRKLTADNAGPRAILDDVDQLVPARLASLRATLELRRKGGIEAAIGRLRTGYGKRIMDRCRVTLGALEGNERRLLETRSAEAQVQAKSTYWTLGFGGSSMLLLLVVAGVVIDRDIQNRERARQALRCSQERLRMALHAANAGAWEWDLRTNANIWSEEIWELYGLPPHSCEPSYEAWRRVVHSDDRARAERILGEAACEGTDIDLEFRVGDQPGPQHWLMARGQPLRDANGKPERFAGIVMDITRRREAEEALRERERNLRRFTDAAPVAIAMFDTQMRYLAASQRYRDDYEIGPRQLIGRGHYDVFPEIPEAWREIHRRCLAGAVERNVGEPFLRADGTEQWIRWEIQTWRQADGSIGGIVLFSEDITAQKQAEERILQLHAELEQRVVERTEELQASNKELEAFAYSVSHDLRAPLRGIDGWSLALLEDYAPQLDENAKEYLERVRSETQRMGC